jgi:hypothetical protein
MSNEVLTYQHSIEALSVGLSEVPVHGNALVDLLRDHQPFIAQQRTPKIYNHSAQV